MGRTPPRNLHVLHVEPDDALACAVGATFSGLATTVDVVRVGQLETAIRQLIDGRYDATLVSAAVVDGDHDGDLAAALVEDIAVHAPATAVIVCTRGQPDRIVRPCLRAGASDVVAATDLRPHVLERVLLAAIDRKSHELAIRALTSTDDLTGIGNRRSLDAWHRGAANKLRRSGGSLVVGIVDLDRFKAVNDGVGHLAGDAVLVAVAERLVAAFRPDDVAVRLGGDEFALVVHSADADARRSIEARVVAALGEPPLLIGGRAVTASSGFAATSDPDRPLRDLLAAADRAMYHDKRRRRPPATHDA